PSGHVTWAQGGTRVIWWGCTPFPLATSPPQPSRALLASPPAAPARYALAASCATPLSPAPPPCGGTSRPSAIDGHHVPPAPGAHSSYCLRLRLAPSAAPGHTAPEEHGDDLLAADGANQLTQRAVDEEQHDEPELDGPEMRPDNLTHQLPVRHTEVPRVPPERHEVLQVVDEQGARDRDHRLPHDVVHQRLVREAIDKRQLVGDEDDLGNEQPRHRPAADRGRGEAMLPEHQPPVDHDNMKGDEKKDRRRQDLVQLMLQPMPDSPHSGPPGASTPPWRSAPPDAFAVTVHAFL